MAVATVAGADGGEVLGAALLEDEASLEETAVPAPLVKRCRRRVPAQRPRAQAPHLGSSSTPRSTPRAPLRQCREWRRGSLGCVRAPLAGPLPIGVRPPRRADPSDPRPYPGSGRRPTAVPAECQAPGPDVPRCSPRSRGARSTPSCRARTNQAEPFVLRFETGHGAVAIARVDLLAGLAGSAMEGGRHPRPGVVEVHLVVGVDATTRDVELHAPAAPMDAEVRQLAMGAAAGRSVQRRRNGVFSSVRNTSPQRSHTKTRGQRSQLTTPGTTSL